MNILITGGCGFVGSNLAIKLKGQYPHFRIYCFDNLKRRGSELNIARLKSLNIEFIHGDIRTADDFTALPIVDLIIEAAAEPSVLAGINSEPNYLVNTNLFGTVNCLNYAKKSNASIIFLSTSRVYPIKYIEQAITVEEDTRFVLSNNQIVQGLSIKGISEEFPMNGTRSLYGATKYCSELIIQEYAEIYGIKTIINRCGVITGPYQMGKVDQGVVVLWLAKHFYKGSLDYIGYGGQGKQVRDLLDINDLFRLIDFQIHHLEAFSGSLFNVGGGTDCSLSLLELTRICEDITGNKIKIGSIKENRPADIKLYLTDNSKITNASGWSPAKNPRLILEEIYVWIKNNEQQLKSLLS